MTSVTTTTIVLHTVGRSLFRLTPTSWEIGTLLLAFGVVMALVALMAIRNRR